MQERSRTLDDNREPEKKADTEKDPAAVALGRKGGLKGGVERWRGVPAKERSALARKAAQARWKKKS